MPVLITILIIVVLLALLLFVFIPYLIYLYSSIQMESWINTWRKMIHKKEESKVS